MLKFATIGTSEITRKFLEVASLCEEFELHAVYSRDRKKAESFGHEYGVMKFYDSLEDMANDSEIDAVYIASPNSLHFEQSMKMLNAKKHVLCEKSMGANKIEVVEMIKTAKANGVILLEAMRSVYDPGLELVKENLHKLGCIRRVNFQFCQYSSRYDAFKRGEMTNIFSKELSAGALMDIGVYCVQAMVGLFGQPNDINTMPILLKTGIDGAGTILAKYDDMIAELSYSKITNSGTSSQIQGEKGVMLISEIHSQRKIVISYNDGTGEEIEVESCDNNMIYELQYFMRAIKQEVEVERYHQISYMAIDVMDRARKQMGIVFPSDGKTL